MDSLTNLINAPKSLLDGKSLESFSVMPPALSHHKTAVECNISPCSREPVQKRKRVVTCSVCSKAGQTDGIGHRAKKHNNCK